MNIYEKLLAIQTRLKAPKNEYNKFGGFYYRNCEDILEAVKPILAEVKAVVIIKDEVELIGSRYYVKAIATLIDAEITDKTVAVNNIAYAREDESKKGMDGAQLTGATSSYARKYALNGLFAIDDNKDSDNGDGDNETPKPTLDEKLLAEAEDLGIELDKVATYLKKPVNLLTNTDLQRCIDQKKKALEGKK